MSSACFSKMTLSRTTLALAAEATDQPDGLSAREKVVVGLSSVAELDPVVEFTLRVGEGFGVASGNLKRAARPEI
jgi:hypothetical protein